MERPNVPFARQYWVVNTLLWPNAFTHIHLPFSCGHLAIGPGRRVYSLGIHYSVFLHLFLQAKTLLSILFPSWDEATNLADWKRRNGIRAHPFVHANGISSSSSLLLNFYFSFQQPLFCSLQTSKNINLLKFLSTLTRLKW